MAMALLRYHLQDNKDVVVESAASLKEHEGKILSGRPASEGTTEVLSEKGLLEFLNHHRSRFVGDIDVASYDEVHCMSEENMQVVKELFPETNPKVMLSDNGGIPNPFQKGVEAYRECYATLMSATAQMANRLRR